MSSPHVFAPCMHDGCRCARSRAGSYCSPYCANVEEGESLPGEAELPGSCACGHAACEAHPPKAGREIVTSTGRS